MSRAPPHAGARPGDPCTLSWTVLRGRAARRPRVELEARNGGATQRRASRARGAHTVSEPRPHRPPCALSIGGNTRHLLRRRSQDTRTPATEPSASSLAGIEVCSYSCHIQAVGVGRNAASPHSSQKNFGESGSLPVSASTPPDVMSSVCSNCAERFPSLVVAVH